MAEGANFACQADEREVRARTGRQGVHFKLNSTGSLEVFARQIGLKGHHSLPNDPAGLWMKLAKHALRRKTTSASSWRVFF